MNAKSSQVSFIDTNILLYAHDRRAGKKQAVAAQLLAELWDTRSGALSPQVLQEFLVNAIRKLKDPLALPQARDIVRTYGVWITRDTGVTDLLRATELMELTGFSFWDSLILASAEAVDASVLYSEDLQDGQQIAGLTIRNPFVKASR